MAEKKNIFLSFLLGAVMFNKGLPILFHLLYWTVIIALWVTR